MPPADGRVSKQMLKEASLQLEYGCLKLRDLLWTVLGEEAAGLAHKAMLDTPHWHVMRALQAAAGGTDGSLDREQAREAIESGMSDHAESALFGQTVGTLG